MNRRLAQSTLFVLYLGDHHSTLSSTQRCLRRSGDRQWKDACLRRPAARNAPEEVHQWKCLRQISHSFIDYFSDTWTGSTDIRYHQWIHSIVRRWTAFLVYSICRWDKAWSRCRSVSSSRRNHCHRHAGSSGRITQDQNSDIQPSLQPEESSQFYWS